MLEDVLTTDQRPKLEDYGDYLFLVLRMLDLGADGELMIEQVGLVLGPGWVLSFQERSGDVFDPLRERLRNGRSRIRQQGADFLAYSLLDAVVDRYFGILERFGEQIDALEDSLLGCPTAEDLARYHRLRRELIFLRKAVWPLREMLATLQRRESPLISVEAVLYLRDVHDHAVQIVDTVETFRDMLNAALDVHLSSSSYRLNDVMKMLAVIATIFMPLTFMAGVYGMNFKHMPELGWPWAYPGILVLMALVALGMLRLFRQKGWL